MFIPIEIDLRQKSVRIGQLVAIFMDQIEKSDASASGCIAFPEKVVRTEPLKRSVSLCAREHELSFQTGRECRTAVRDVRYRGQGAQF